MPIKELQQNPKPNAKQCKMHNVGHPIKVNRHTKKNQKHENMIYDQQNNQSIETDTKMTDTML